MNIVVLGLALTSSWGNGHATTYRSLLKGLHKRGHRVLFLERDQPWYAAHRDAPALDCCETGIYGDTVELERRYADAVREADAVIVGSYVPEGAEVCRWVLECARGVRMFYDIDTPITLTRLATDACEYLRRDQVPQFDAFLSFTGGPTLQRLESEFGARQAWPLYCSVDPDSYRPLDDGAGDERPYDLGYMGTYSEDRQLALELLLNGPAEALPSRSFIVVGAQYPAQTHWPANVQRIDHLPPDRHRDFYCAQRFTLNLTRADMKRAGHSPSVRLFEAAACGTPIISDDWPGLEELLRPGSEILIARDTKDVIGFLRELGGPELQDLARRARSKVLTAHTGERRAAELESCIEQAHWKRQAALSAAGQEIRPALRP